ncbi:MAG: PKD domain-containing protein, partial [Candidatus Lutacidiplasmatales archaeon]
MGVSPYSLAYDPARHVVFVANSGNTLCNTHNVSVISDANNSVVATVSVGCSPASVAYDAGRSEVFVGNFESKNVSVISDTNNTVVATVAVGDYPLAIAYDPALGEVFVANSGSGTVSVISDTNNSVVATISVGDYPSCVAYDPGQAEVFVANLLSDNVSVISDTNNTVVAWVGVGTYPYGLAYDPARGEMFVADFMAQNVSVIADASNNVVASIPVGVDPHGLAYDPGLGEVFVADTGGNNVSILSDATDSVVATLAVGVFPVGVVYDSGQGEVFVANAGANNTTVLTDGEHATTPFTINSTVTIPTATGSLDAGQTVTVKGAGFGSSVAIATFTLGPFALNCTMALAGSCNGGNLGTNSSGSLVARFTAPLVTASGSFNVRLVDALGHTATTVVTVNTDPQAGAPTASPASVDVGQPVTFSPSATSGSGPYTFVWSGLPTPCRSTSGSVHCTPNTVGTSAIFVQATDSNGISAIGPGLNFTVSPDAVAATPVSNRISGQVDAGQNATFRTNATFGTGVYVDYSWSGLPGGCGGTGASVTCSGPDLPAGTFSISVAVTDSNNDTSPASGYLSFTVLNDPSLSPPSPSMVSADVGQNVTFTSRVNLGSGGYGFAWTGLPAGCGGTTDPVECRVSAAGQFTVQMEATDSNNRTVRSGATVFTVYQDPTANLSTDRPALDVGQSVTLRATPGLGSGGFVDVWMGVPTGCTIGIDLLTCAPVQSGSYETRVQVTDSNGVSALSAPVPVVVAPGLSAEVVANPSSPTPGQSVSFAANGTGGTGVLAYAWEFGDGSKGLGPTVRHTFGAAATYAVTVWVNDTVGGSVEQLVNFTVVPTTTALGRAWAEFGPVVVVLLAIVAVAASVLLVRRRAHRRPPADNSERAARG